MAQTRVDVLREVRIYDPGEWQLCFQWCRYRYDDEPLQYGYRFIWRRAEDGSLQAARGQARIPSLEDARALMDHAISEGWGDRSWDVLVQAAERLRENGCVVDLNSGYVGWPDKEAAMKGHLTPAMIADSRQIQAWTS